MVDWLNAHGLSAPSIWARDEARGFALMQDFGDRHIANDPDMDRAIFYREAVETLLHLHNRPAADFLNAYDGKVQAVEEACSSIGFCPIAASVSAIRRGRAISILASHRRQIDRR